MTDPRLYENDHFVVLESDQPEQFLTTPELVAKLTAILAERQDNLPRELQKFDSISQQAQHLMETACELDMQPGQFLQWYAVRLEK
jgi:hypothetical protein